MSSACTLHCSCPLYDLGPSDWRELGIGSLSGQARRYSVTFGQLRRARTEHRKNQRHPEGQRDPWGRPLDDTAVLVLSTWRYDGPACTIAPSAELALTAAALARDHELAAADDAA